jgi:micrococcal nuclease
VLAVMIHGERRARAAVALALLCGVLAACGGAATQASHASAAAPRATDLTPKGRTVEHVPVLRVVDGDTLHVLVDGHDVTIRLIGINTPETVKPGSPVECFGPEASEYAKAVLDGARVTVEYDASQGMTDRYGRTLAYVWLELPEGGRSLFNLDAVTGGFAEARQYGPTPYGWKTTFDAAQAHARAVDAGMWGACPP